MSDKLIQPRTLPGFRDIQPPLMMAREKLMETARRVYRSFGYAPIDTPALEYSEILLGKGGEESDKQIFRFTDQGDRDVAMRFDLTIPFARFSAQYIGQLGTPFKRYHIGTVWRAERQQRGRYREFIQCDFDTIGTDSNASDIETLLVINELLTQIGIERFTIRVNHRKLLNGLLSSLNLEQNVTPILRALDKLPKVGADAVVEEMVRVANCEEKQARTILEFAGLKGTSQEILNQVKDLIGSNESGQQGIQCLQELFQVVEQLGLPEGRVQLDVSIARGLDYYTGTIYETFLGDLPEIGSVCSGGRYDNLAGLYTKQKLPGVGASLGLDRLLAAQEELGLLSQTSTPTKVLIVQFSQQYLPQYFEVANLIRAGGVACEVYPEAKKLGQQIKYADQKGMKIALIGGETEIKAGQWQVKVLDQSTQETVNQADLVTRLKAILS